MPHSGTSTKYPPTRAPWRCDPTLRYRSSLKADKLPYHGTGMCSVPLMDRVDYSSRERPAVRPRDHIIRRAGY